MKVFIMDPVSPKVVEEIASKYEVVAYPECRDRNWHEEADALLVRTWVVSAEDMAKAKKLKIIAKHGVGVDNIDLPAAKAHNILVTNTPGANAVSVAEYVVTLTLSLYRSVPLYSYRVRYGEWKALPKAFEISEKTIGLVGLGDIGLRAAKIFSGGFGARVLAYDPFAPQKVFIDNNVERVQHLDDLLTRCDVISLHVPLTPQTKNMIGERELHMMKEDSVLINVSRGGIVNEEDLYHALKNNVIFSAACDVFVDEPLNKNCPLLELDNFIGSPHVGGSSNESLIRMGMGAFNNIDAALNGQLPKNLII
ncbi:NAD(P)-dependent oxidoreductase [Buttiauxella massiliensis]|uniref:NAD(P)-dependent oxidoreductase n=1 Tax=Buttiauxella massiliensis TaxID=2831590 RepID=UPI00125F8B3D|nr:hydroxyacid dehydrogenase [Buttiauxella massiliensis]